MSVESTSGWQERHPRGTLNHARMLFLEELVRSNEAAADFLGVSQHEPDLTPNQFIVEAKVNLFNPNIPIEIENIRLDIQLTFTVSRLVSTTTEEASEIGTFYNAVYVIHILKFDIWFQILQTMHRADVSLLLEAALEKPIEELCATIKFSTGENAEWYVDTCKKEYIQSLLGVEN